MKRIIIADSDHDELVLCKAAVTATGQAEIAAESTSYALIPSLIERHKPDYVFLAHHGQLGSIVETIQKIRSQNSTCHIIIVGEESDADDILQCFRSGADEYLVRPLHEHEIHQVFERLKPRIAGNTSAAPEDEGEAIAFCGSRGGCGTTTIAANCASNLIKHGSTVLVDFHFDQGDLAIFLDTQPTVSLVDLSENAERLDETLVESIITKHKSGLHLLLQSYDRQTPYLRNEEIKRLIQILKRKYDYVLLDVGTDLTTAGMISTLINHYCLIVRQDLPSLFVAKPKLELLEQAGISEEQVTIIVNGFSKRNPVNVKRIARAVNRNNPVIIRLDDENCQSAINQGVPLQEVSRWSKAAKDITTFSEQLRKKEKPGSISFEEEDAKEERSSFIRLKPFATIQQPVAG